MRKAVLDFLKLEDKPFLLSGCIDINTHLEEILKIYDQGGRDCKAILIGDISLLLWSYIRHKSALTTTAPKRTLKENGIILKSWKRRPPFKTLRQTKGEHESAMLHIEELLSLLILSTAKGYGIYLSDSDLHGDELKLYENLIFEDGQTFPEMVKSLYGHEHPKEQTPLEKVLKEWNQGRPKRLLILLEKNGFITKNGDVYNWKIDNDNDYTNNLYVYFVYIASEKLDWRKGKDKKRMPWDKFNPLFPNMATNQNSRNQDLRKIKKDIFPRRAADIDNLFDW